MPIPDAPCRRERGLRLRTPYSSRSTTRIRAVESCVRICVDRLPGGRIYLLDDSDPQKRMAMQEIGRKYCLHSRATGRPAGAINHALALLNSDTPYLLVIDADQKVKPTILAELVPLLEADPGVSFIQTPQFFRSEPHDPISVTFSYQQHIYNKHVCRGLSVNNTAADRFKLHLPGEPPHRYWGDG